MTPDDLAEREAILVVYGGLSPTDAEAIAGLSVPYYLHRENCDACRGLTQCHEGARLWRRYAKAARQARA